MGKPEKGKEIEEKKEGKKSIIERFREWLARAMNFVGIFVLSSFMIVLAFRIFIFIENTLMEHGSLTLKTGLGDIHMTKFMPTLFLVFYVITPIVAFIGFFKFLGRDSEEKGGK